jgi:hypothetical protein
LAGKQLHPPGGEDLQQRAQLVICVRTGSSEHWQTTGTAPVLWRAAPFDRVIDPLTDAAINSGSKLCR